MTDSGDSTSHLNTSPIPSHHPRRRRRCLVILLVVVLLLLLVAAVVVLVLFLTVLRPRDPTSTLLSATVDGVSPRLSFPALRLQLNLTLSLAVLVHNPNRAAFAHSSGRTQLLYRGAQVGDAVVAPGRIPPRGSEQMHMELTVQADRLASDTAALVADVVAGAVDFETDTVMPGRITFLGFIKRHAVARSQCRVEIGVPDLKIRRQECTQETKL